MLVDCCHFHTPFCIGNKHAHSYLVAAQVPLQDVKLSRDLVRPLVGITQRMMMLRTLSCHAQMTIWRKHLSDALRQQGSLAAGRCRISSPQTAPERCDMGHARSKRTDCCRSQSSSSVL